MRNAPMDPGGVNLRMHARHRRVLRNGTPDTSCEVQDVAYSTAKAIRFSPEIRR